MTTTTNATRFETRGKDATRGFIGGISQRFARYRTYRRTLDELEGLSDRELADLALHRSQLRGVAYRAAYEG
mgnify:CR=1 FL=1